MGTEAMGTAADLMPLCQCAVAKYSGPLHRSFAAGSLDLRPIRKHTGRLPSNTGLPGEASLPLLAPEPSGQSGVSDSEPSHKNEAAEQSAPQLVSALSIRFDGAHAVVRGEADETPRSAFGEEVEENPAYLAKLSSRRISMATVRSKAHQEQRRDCGSTLRVAIRALVLLSRLSL